MGLSGDGLCGRRVLEQRHVEVAPVTPDLYGLLEDDGEQGWESSGASGEDSGCSQ